MRNRSRKQLLIYCLLLQMLATCVSAAVSAGRFSAAQAEHGKLLYNQHCASCHGAKLVGASAPGMVGDDFLLRWSGENQSVGDLLYVIKTTMPLGSAGIISAQDNLDIVTYILAENGSPAGTDSLHADDPLIETMLVGTEAHRNMAAGRGLTCPAIKHYDADNLPRELVPDQTELGQAAADPEDWLLHGHDYQGHRFSPLRQINTSNVAGLQQVCSYDTDDELAFQTLPLARDGRLYFTTNTETIVIDAASCAEVWRHSRPLRCSELWQHSRGLSLKDGLAVRGSPDGYLYALNAETGQLVWERRVNDSDVTGVGIPMPPMIYRDKVIIAPSTSDIGLKGWVRAYRLQDGERLWHFNVVPEPGAAAAASWGSEKALQRGGGGIWTPFSLDTATETVYMATANPGPAFYPEVRPGDNLYTNTMLALDVNNGQLRWHAQMVPADYHDWDLMHASPLYEVGARKYVFVAGKDGYVHGLDRDSHERVFSVAVSRQENVDAPISPGIETRFCPGIGGGIQFNAPAFYPVLNTIFVNSVDWCTAVRQTDEIRFVRGGLYMGGYFTMDPLEKASGRLLALDAATGKERWHYASSRPMLAAITSTAGGLVFSGELSGALIALDAKTGRKLLSIDTGAALNGGIITYAHQGRQYVAVAAGSAAAFWLSPAAKARMLVFALPE